MPPATLRILPESLQAQSTRLKRVRGDELQAAIADLRTLSQRLDAAWSGEARAAFGDGFSGWLTRAERRGQDLERIAAFLTATAAKYRALEADLVDGATEVPARPHHQDATRAQPAPGNTGGPSLGMGGGIYAGAGGTFSPIALTGNPLEDLWNWLMGLFGAAPDSQAAPTPTPRTPMTVGVNPWPTPSQFPWEAADSDDTHSVVCTADPSTTPANLQPYLINAACTNLVGQLEPIAVAHLIQEVNSGQTILTPMLVNGFWVLQATNALTGETHILATVQDEGDEGGPAANPGGGTGSGGATGSAIDDAERIATERHVSQNGTLANIDQATLDTRKFENYSLDPANPNNKGKAQGFAQLGYDVSTAEGRQIAATDIIRQVDPQLEAAPAVYSETTNHGAKFELRSVITGPNGSTGTLVTVWIFEEGSQVPRLVTNWVEVHK